MYFGWFLDVYGEIVDLLKLFATGAEFSCEISGIDRNSYQDLANDALHDKIWVFPRRDHTWPH